MRTALLAFLLIAQSLLASANQEPPKLGASYLKLSFNEDKNGIYDQILTKAMQQAGYAPNYSTQPLSRALANFRKGSFACITPYSKRLNAASWSENPSNSLIYSLPFHQTTFVAYYKDETLSQYRWKDNESKNLRVGLPYATEDFKILKYLDIHSEKLIKAKNVKMLIEQIHKGRSDVIIYTHPMPIYLSEKLSYGELHFNKEDAVITDDLSIACHDNDINRAFIERINRQLLALWKNGYIKSTLKEVYGSHTPLPAPIKSALENN